MGVKRDRNEAEMSNSITEDEAALYDRQIRLWGMECQKRLREAEVLVIGLNGLGVDAVKNLALSGVKSIALIDETPVTELDSTSQFFAVGHEGEGRASASLQSIRALNPNVTVSVDSTPVSSITVAFLSSFTMVFATGLPAAELIRLSEACHEQKVRFCCGEAWGFHGYAFFDLLEHKYSRCQKNEKDEMVTEFKTAEYCPLGPTLGAKVGAGLNKRISRVYPLMTILNNFREKHGRLPVPARRSEDLALLKEERRLTLDDLKFGQDKVDDEMLGSVFGELSPVCSVLGGVIANEMIKGISGKGIPICNFLLFDGDTSVCSTATVVIKEQN